MPSQRSYIVKGFMGGNKVRGVDATNLLFDTYDMSNTPIFNASVEEEVNKVASFNFTMGAQHPLIDCPEIFKNWVLVVQYAGVINNGNWEPVAQSVLFYGRILSVETDLYGNKAISCESSLGFLNDYLVREKDFWYYIEDGQQYIVTGSSDLINNVVHASQYIIDAHDAPENPESSFGTSLNYQDMIDKNFKRFSTTDSWLQFEKIYDNDDDVDHDDDVSVKTLIDVINDDLFSNVGGILYVNPTPSPSLPSPISLNRWTNFNEIDLKVYYCREPSSGFGMGVGYGGVRRYDTFDPNGTRPPMDSELFPRFVLGENVLDVAREPAMDTIFTGVFPVGKDGLLLANQSSPVGSMDFNTRYLWSQSANKYGRIAIALDLPNITSRTTLRKLAQNWLNKHTSDGLIEEYKYTITGPEPVVLGYGSYFIEIGAGVLYSEDSSEDPSQAKGYTCLSKSIDVFKPQNNKYTFAPYVAENYSETTISKKMSKTKTTNKAKKK